ncbi:MAG: trypsin-like peptidase domain-containing protein [Thermoleophilaceae bacterium]|nr:trypsin-like peptidase domain-containing protein [Thermoleophilaceae bacterium]
MSSPSRLSLFLAGILGGLVVLVLGAVLISTDVIDTGDSTKEVVREPAPLTRPASDSGGGRTVSEIYREEGRGVVFVRAEGVAASEGPFGLPGGKDGTATGSGFVVDEDGTIITNAHVVEGSDEVSVSFEEDGSDLIDAKVLGRDESTDLAVLRVNPNDVKDLRVVPLGSSKDAKVGDPVVAIGNPFGYTRTVTTGIVSAVARRINAPNDFTIGNVIQTDASINPGNSGGPLLDAEGRVIGINAQIATGGTEGSVGIGFAIPIDTAKDLLPQLRKGEDIQRGFLGVSAATVDVKLAEELKLPADEGALIAEVRDGSPADDAGLRAGDAPSADGPPRGGDLIVSIGGEAITSSDDLVTAVEQKGPGDEVEVEYFRGKEKKSVTVKLGERPDKAGIGGPRAP